MRQTVLAVPLLVSLAFIGAHPATAFAQDKTARGTVSAMTADSVTVKVQNTDMKFMVDAKTIVEAAGAGTKAREAERAGQAGAKLADVVKVGQAVEVTYAGAAMHASKIRGITADAVAAATTTATTTADKSSDGTVKSIAANTLTITGGSGGGSTFTQTFAIDADTKVVAKGAGTATAAKGGKAAVTDLVAAGDKVSVSYKTMGTMLHATEIRVVTKGAPK